jgi:hypothetical protein
MRSRHPQDSSERVMDKIREIHRLTGGRGPEWGKLMAVIRDVSAQIERIDALNLSPAERKRVLDATGRRYFRVLQRFGVERAGAVGRLHVISGGKRGAR